MTSDEALQLAIAGKTREHARKMGLSTSLVNKWQEPATDFSDSGAYNPLDRIETIIETALALNTPPQNALAPLHYLNQKFNLITRPLPCSAEQEDVHQEFMKSISNFGAFVKTVSDALADYKLTPQEKKAIKKNTWELFRQLEGFLESID